MFVTLDLDFSQQVVHSVENAIEHDSLGKRSLDRPFTKFHHVTADSSGGRSLGFVGVAATATATTTTTTTTTTATAAAAATSRGSRRSRKRKVNNVSPQDGKEEEEEEEDA